MTCARKIQALIAFCVFFYGAYFLFLMWRMPASSDTLTQTIEPTGLRILPEFTGQPPIDGIYSKMCTKADFSAPWLLNSSLIRTKLGKINHHRKFWELTYVTYVIEHLSLCKPGKRGLVFAAGKEPLISLFASLGCSIVATDMPPDLANFKDWSQTNQHASNLQDLFIPTEGFSKDDFSARVTYLPLNMNFLPQSIDGQFDFIWSLCSLEHVGTIRLGQRVVLNAMDLLKPGGVAFHSVEFTVSSLDRTLESGATVLWRKRDIEELVADLSVLGYHVFPVHFGAGDSVVDRTPDIPPYGQVSMSSLIFVHY